MSGAKTTPAQSRAMVILILAVATALKAAWALNSAGSLDVVIFWKFATHLQDHTLKYMYEKYPAFNHPPLTAAIIWLLCKLANGRYFFFAAALRFLSIFADIGVVLGLLHIKKLTGRPPWWAIYAFAISPVSLIVSGFHGNMDPLMVMFTFFAGVAVLRDRPALSGILLAVAFNIKIVPILLTPAFFFYWFAKGPRQAIAFTGATVTGFLTGAALPLIQCPIAYASHVLAYGSVCGVWGITYWLRTMHLDAFETVDFRSLSFLQNFTMTLLKLVIIVMSSALAWRRRKEAGAEFFATLGMIWTIFFVFAPGTVVQYMPWYAPFVLILAPRWWAALTVASTAFMAAYYHPASDWQFPWVLAHPETGAHNWSEEWSNLPWSLFVGLFVFLAWKSRPEVRQEIQTPVSGTAGATLEPFPAACHRT